jgi:hypothetical protein
MNCTDLEVFDHATWREEIFRESLSNEIVATPRSWFGYYVLGWLYRWIDFDTWFANKQKHLGDQRPGVFVRPLTDLHLLGIKLWKRILRHNQENDRT